MLSIRLNSDAEWWVSGESFARLFQTALQDGSMPPDFENWLHVADANGGLTVAELPAEDATTLIAALRSTAVRELDRLRGASAVTPDGSYCVSLQKLLALETSV